MPRALPRASSACGAPGACSARSRIPDVLAHYQEHAKPMSGIVRWKPGLVIRPEPDAEALNQPARAVRARLHHERPGGSEIGRLRVLQERAGGLDVRGFAASEAASASSACRRTSSASLKTTRACGGSAMRTSKPPPGCVGRMSPIPRVRGTDRSRSSWADSCRARRSCTSRPGHIPSAPTRATRPPVAPRYRSHASRSPSHRRPGRHRAAVVVLGAATPGVPPREHDAPDEDGAATTPAFKTRSLRMSSSRMTRRRRRSPAS